MHDNAGGVPPVWRTIFKDDSRLTKKGMMLNPFHEVPAPFGPEGPEGSDLEVPELLDDLFSMSRTLAVPQEL